MHALNAVISCVALCFAACAERDETPEARFTILVRADRDVGLAGASVELDGRFAGQTDVDGRLDLHVPVQASRVRVAVRCPEGFHASEPRSVALRRGGRSLPLQLAFDCRPSQRSLLLIVRAPEASGTPVLVDGELLGSVAADGTLHALIRRAPGVEVRVSLDTSSAPRLMPADPMREFAIRDQDEIVVFDQPFSLAEPRAARRPRSRHAHVPSSPSSTHLPYAIEATY
jgi:hypothetical protein